MNKTFKLIILCLVILFVSGALLFLYLGKVFFIKNSISCTGSTRTAIDVKNLQNIRSCNDVESFDIEGEKFDFVSISYGHGMDCPSGCIYHHYEGLVDSEGKVYDFYALRNPFHILSKKYGHVCTRLDYDKDDPPYYQRRIIRDGETFRWQLVFQNFDVNQTRRDSWGDDENPCIINGTLDIPPPSNPF